MMDKVSSETCIANLKVKQINAISKHRYWKCSWLQIIRRRHLFRVHLEVNDSTTLLINPTWQRVKYGDVAHIALKVEKHLKLFFA